MGADEVDGRRGAGDPLGADGRWPSTAGPRRFIVIFSHCHPPLRLVVKPSCLSIDANFSR